MRFQATRSSTVPNIITRLIRRLPRLALVGAVGVLAACAAQDPLEEDLPDMGDFRLAHNIVVAENMQQVPPSRNATPEEWQEIITSEIDRRFGSYEGDRLYHIGINVDGYALAPPGIPIVLNPRSVLVLSVNVWDDELGQKLHEEPEQIVIFEGSSPETFLLGSGLTRSREEQMQVLARNAARRVQLWMLQNPEWFNIDPDAAEAAAAEVEQIAEASETPIDAAAAAEGAAAEACVPTEETPCPEPAAEALSN
jgi:hypothetical protein